MRCERCGDPVAQVRARSSYIIVNEQPRFYTAYEVSLGVSEVVGAGGIVKYHPEEGDFGYMRHQFFCIKK